MLNVVWDFFGAGVHDDGDINFVSVPDWQCATGLRIHTALREFAQSDHRGVVEGAASADLLFFPFFFWRFLGRLLPSRAAGALREREGLIFLCISL